MFLKRGFRKMSCLSNLNGTTASRSEFILILKFITITVKVL